MKKTYLEPNTFIYRIRPVHMIAESLVVGKKTDSGNPLDGSDDDNGAWSRNDIFNDDHTIWDNVW